MTKYVKPVVIAGLIFFLVYAILYSSGALAGSATVGWTAPTTKQDGTPLPLTLILRFDVEYSLSTTFVPLLGTVTAPGTATSVLVPTLPAGTYYFRAFAVSAAGRSGPSNVGTKIVPDSVPSTPVITTITSVAYELRNNWLNARMVAAGAVGLGETCGTPWRKDGIYARLDSSQVTLSDRYRGGKLFGICA